jgi:purine nucleoside permease
VNRRSIRFPGDIKADALSTTIFSTTQKARQVIDDLRTALTEANATHLKKYLEEVKEYKGIDRACSRGRLDQAAQASGGDSAG